MSKKIFVFFLLTALLFSCKNKQAYTLLFVGSYTDKKPGKGITIFRFDNQTGAVEKTFELDDINNSSFLKLSPDGKYLYAVVESQMPYNGKVAAFKIDSAEGKITLLNQQDCGGRNPVHLEIDKKGDYIVNSNYTDPSLSIFSIRKDGSLNQAEQFIKIEGSSIVEGRQESAHIHSANFSPDQAYLFAQDLGSDKIHTFKFNKNQSGALLLEGKKSVLAQPGSGPRHFTFHSNGNWAYGIAELSGKVTAYRYTAGDLRFIEDYQANNKKQDIYRSADIHISPDGKFLYTTNRGPEENSIAIFSINKKTGKLTLIGHEPTGGEHPRNFAIDPSGNFLLVANQFTDNITIFKRDIRSGQLKKLPKEITVDNPSSLQMRNYQITTP